MYILGGSMPKTSATSLKKIYITDPPKSSAL